MINIIKRMIKNLRIILYKIIKVRTTYRVPFLKRIKMNIMGFTADQYERFNLKNNNIKDYISEFERWKSRDINGRYKIIMDDKIIFAEIFEKYVRIPKNIAWINKGKIYSLGNKKLNVDRIYDLLVVYKSLVVKPVIHGGAGKGVHVIEFKNDKVFLDKQFLEIKELDNFVKSLDNYIITEFIKQHNYADSLFKKTTNTIRVIIIRNPLGDGYIISNVVHRIGVNECIPVDNASRGALVSQVDIETGILGPAKSYFDKTVHRYHPDSGSEIEGIIIPHWELVKSELLSLAYKLPYIKFIAWDVVITEEGFSVIEANASSGLSLFQIWEGQRNTILGKFYKINGIIK